MRLQLKAGKYERKIGSRCGFQDWWVLKHSILAFCDNKCCILTFATKYNIKDVRPAQFLSACVSNAFLNRQNYPNTK